jgi:hypothetical protein
MVTVNYLAILLATLSSFAIGGFWYSPLGFQKIWVKLSGAKMDGDFSLKNNLYIFGGDFIGSLLIAYVLAHITYMSHQVIGESFFVSAITSALVLAIGIAAPVIFSDDAFVGRPKLLTLINVAHKFVMLLVMGLIIGAMGV